MSWITLRRRTRVTISSPSEPRLAAESVAAAAGISASTLLRLVRAGVLDPVEPDTLEFTAATVMRLRRMLRLRHDLDVNLAGAAVVLELLERMEQMEDELARLRAEGGGPVAE